MYRLAYRCEVREVIQLIRVFQVAYHRRNHWIHRDHPEPSLVRIRSSYPGLEGVRARSETSATLLKMEGERWPGLRAVKVEVTAATLALRTGPTFRSAQIPPFDGNHIARQEKNGICRDCDQWSLISFQNSAVHVLAGHSFMKMGKMIMYLNFIIGDNQCFLGWALSNAGAMTRTCVGLFHRERRWLAENPSEQLCISPTIRNVGR